MTTPKSAHLCESSTKMILFVRSTEKFSNFQLIGIYRGFQFQNMTDNRELHGW